MSDLVEKQYRFLEVGERIQSGDEWRAHGSTGTWRPTICEGAPMTVQDKNCYRRLISESETNEETDIPNSTDRGEASTDSSSNQSNRDRHITINKSNYCWNGSVDLTKQHCISVSVEEV